MIREDVDLLVNEALSQTGFDIVRVSVSGRRQIRVILDREPPEKITVKDLVQATRALSRSLDEHGHNHKSFDIQVNSPGLDRLLTRPKDFVRFQGEDVKVRLKVKVDGRRNFKGKLLGWLEDCFAIQPEDGTDQRRFTIHDVAEVRLVPSF